MTYDGYRLVFQIAGVVAIVMLIVSIILFIILKIPGVIGDLSGRTARKGIEDIRMQNMRSGDKRYKTSPVNHERGKLTDKITPSGNLIPGTGYDGSVTGVQWGDSSTIKCGKYEFTKKSEYRGNGRAGCDRIRNSIRTYK